MEIIKKAKLTEEEMEAVEKVYYLADTFCGKLNNSFSEYDKLEAVRSFFEVLHSNTNEVEVQA